jgi:hypothetical protein
MQLVTIRSDRNTKAMEKEEPEPAGPEMDYSSTRALMSIFGANPSIK